MEEIINILEKRDYIKRPLTIRVVMIEMNRPLALRHKASWQYELKIRPYDETSSIEVSAWVDTWTKWYMRLRIKNKTLILDEMGNLVARMAGVYDLKNPLIGEIFINGVSIKKCYINSHGKRINCWPTIFNMRGLDSIRY